MSLTRSWEQNLVSIVASNDFDIKTYHSPFNWPNPAEAVCERVSGDSLDLNTQIVAQLTTTELRTHPLEGVAWRYQDGGEQPDSW